MIILKTKQTIQTIVENNEHKIQEISNSNENNEIKQENNEIITEKEEVETEEFIEDSIYDSIYDDDKSSKIEPIIKESSSSNQADSLLINQEKEINLKKLLIPKITIEYRPEIDNVDENSLNNFIDQFKPEAIRRESKVPSLADLSIESSLTSDLNEINADKSIDDSVSIKSDYLFIDIDFKECIANSFKIDLTKLPETWFGIRNDQRFDLRDSSESWKYDILTDLKIRNIREHEHIDKISIRYHENVCMSLYK